MLATKTCVRAERFQYDYLNDDIADDGTIDYSLTNKLPEALRKAILDAQSGKPRAKKILVLINPPYGEATNADNTVLGKVAKNKTDIKRTRMAAVGMPEYGRSSNELFVQFVARIAKEIPTATLAMFSKLKYINAQASEDFRKVWNALYLNGFVVHNKAFDGLKGDFPIGFLIWKTDNRDGSPRTPIKEISCEAFDKIRERYKLNRPDVGWYQIRNALSDRNDTGNYKPVSFVGFGRGYKELTEKLKPEVFAKGFLNHG